MLLPYNVDRVTRKIPWVTYTLMGVNAFIYLMTVLIANVSLPNDRVEGRKEIASLTQNVPLPSYSDLMKAEGSNENRFRLWQGAQVTVLDDPLAEVNGEQLDTTFVTRIRYFQALTLASKKLETPEDIKRLYLVEHAYDSFTDEPHYSVLNAFAYRPSEPSALQKIFSMFTAMFLHGGLEHLLGNMLMLWIFGRAIEEFLGRRFYLTTYLFSGVAATLMQHWVTQQFTPAAMGVPNLGASGAIAGIMGLFAVRFYRTKVRIFYLFGWGIWAFVIIFAIVSGIVEAIIGQPLVSAILGAIAAAAAMYSLGRGNSWGAFRVPSIWVISAWVVLQNIVPAVWELMQDNGSGGVAYWAHLGGFMCGAFYALAIGGVDEGKTEYALEDAHDALQNAGSDEAIRRAGALLTKDANNPAAHEVTAQAHDRRKNLELASRHYGLAIEGYWKSGERDAAARLYGIALKKHPQLALRPALLLSLSSHCAKNLMWDQSAALLTRIVEEFPDSPEAEIALLRAAGLWMKQYGDPAEALRMAEMFRARYPMSEWEIQLQGIERAARDLLAQRQG